MATAGVAAADVTVTGLAEMGLSGGTGTQTQFFTDIDVTFTMSGETDNGLTFGASIDLDESDGSGSFDDSDTVGASPAFDPATQGGETIFLSGDFGTITMGDTDGALDWALTEAWVGNAGSIADDETGHAGALGSYGDGFYDGQILRYDYTIADFGVAVSVEMDDTGVSDVGYAVGFQYGLDFGGGSLDLGLGYQTMNFTAPTAGGTVEFGDFPPITLAAGDTVDVDIIGVSAAVELDSGLSAGIQYSVWDVDTVLGGTPDSTEVDHIGVGVGYTFDAITVSGNWGQFHDGTDTISGYGLAAAYALGGGAAVHFGYGYSDFGALAADESSWSLGLAMSF